MSCAQTGTIECSTVQVLEPQHDFLVDTSGAASDMQEHGEVDLVEGQTGLTVFFTVPKLNNEYVFEYLYVDVQGIPHPGTVIPIPAIKDVVGFTIRLAGSPLSAGYVLHWRVVINQTSIIASGATDVPELFYLQMPRLSIMNIIFAFPRSSLNYGFTELRVENTSLEPNQVIINVQLIVKELFGCAIGINPVPPTDHYYLRVRTP